MKCPKCSTQLVQKSYKGLLEVDYCPNCRGMWLDFTELDRLEDVAFDQDQQKGSLVHYQSEVDYLCPQCDSKLQEFQYRLYDLKLETCAENDHGFWLDAGEDVRVMDIMAARALESRRKINAENEWRGLLSRMHALMKR